MAFWKKSEDPWDMDPQKRKKAAEKVSIGKQDLKPPPWARVKETPAPVACPWCGRDMVWGTLFVTQSLGMTWEEGEQKNFLESFGTDRQTKRLSLGRSEEAWYCTECRKLTMDINVAMSRSGPNYIWKDGKVVFPQKDEEE